MRSLFRKAGITAVAALSLVGATLAASSSAEARYYHRGWRGGGWAGPAIVGGLALGALAASRPSLRWLRLLRRRLHSKSRGRLHRLRPSDRSASQRLLLSAIEAGDSGTLPIRNGLSGTRLLARPVRAVDGATCGFNRARFELLCSVSGITKEKGPAEAGPRSRANEPGQVVKQEEAHRRKIHGTVADPSPKIRLR